MAFAKFWNHQPNLQGSYLQSNWRFCVILTFQNIYHENNFCLNYCNCSGTVIIYGEIYPWPIFYLCKLGNISFNIVVLISVSKLNLNLYKISSQQLKDRNWVFFAEFGELAFSIRFVRTHLVIINSFGDPITKYYF